MGSSFVGTHDDLPLDSNIGLFVQPDLNPRLALQVPEDQVLPPTAAMSAGVAMRMLHKLIGLVSSNRATRGSAREQLTIGCVIIFCLPDMVVLRKLETNPGH